MAAAGSRTAGHGWPPCCHARPSASTVPLVLIKTGAISVDPRTSTSSNAQRSATECKRVLEYLCHGTALKCRPRIAHGPLLLRSRAAGWGDVRPAALRGAHIPLSLGGRVSRCPGKHRAPHLHLGSGTRSQKGAGGRRDRPRSRWKRRQTLPGPSSHKPQQKRLFAGEFFFMKEPFQLREV